MIKIQAYQSKGVETDHVVDEFDFCCWKALYRWLGKYSDLHGCSKCNGKEDKK